MAFGQALLRNAQQSVTRKEGVPFRNTPSSHTPIRPDDLAATHFALGLKNEEFTPHVWVHVTPEGILLGLTDTGRRIVLGGLAEGEGRGLSRIHMKRLDPIGYNLLRITFHANLRILHDP